MFLTAETSAALLVSSHCTFHDSVEHTADCNPQEVLLSPLPFRCYEDERQWFKYTVVLCIFLTVCIEMNWSMTVKLFEVFSVWRNQQYPQEIQGLFHRNLVLQIKEFKMELAYWLCR